MAAVRRILLSVLPKGSGLRLLDIGCGDGFMLRAFADMPAFAEVHGADINLPDRDLVRMSFGKVRFFNDPSRLTGHYDVILLCDVLEHVDADVDFLRQVAARYASPGTVFIITVPAWQRLFFAHDTFLGHYRRYSFRRLRRTIEDAGLKWQDRGALFLLLLFFRGLGVLGEKMAGVGSAKAHGIGRWRGGRFLTAVLFVMMQCDNYILWLFSRIGVRLPGLSLWAVARRAA
jgi:SAM-dependent methyltransferase